MHAAEGLARNLLNSLWGAHRKYIQVLAIRYVHRTTHLLLSASLLVGFVWGMRAPIIPIFAANELGATYSDIGVIVTVTCLPYVLVPLALGIVLGRINDKYLLATGFAASAVSLYLISTSTTITELTLYCLLLGLSYSLIWPPAIHAVSQNPDTRVKLTTMLMMCRVIGFMVGPLVGSFILGTFGVDDRTLLLITACITSAGVVLFVLNYPHHKSKGVRLDLRLFKEVLKFPVQVTVLLYSTVTFGLVLSLYPVFIQEHGFDAAAVMQLYAVFGITQILGSFLAKRLVVHRRKILLLSTSCVIVAMAVSMMATTFAEFVVAMLLLGFGFISIYPVILDMLLAGSRKFAAGRMIGAYEGLYGIGLVVGPFVSGYIGYTLGADSLYLILLATGLAVLLLTFLYRNRMRTAITVLKHDAESPKRRAIFVKQELKNQLGVILLGIGLIDRRLKSPGTYNSIQSDIADAFKTVNLTKTRVNEVINDADDIVHSALVKEIRDTLSKVGKVDPISGAGKGYPDYDNIREMITSCTDGLDRSITDDAVLK